MDVYEGLHKQFPKLYYHTFNVDEEKLNALIKKYQDIWDGGKKLQLSMMEMLDPPDRDPANEDEDFSTVVGWLAERVLDLVIEEWIRRRQFSGGEMLYLLSSFGALDRNIAFKIDDKCEINIVRIIKVWNKIHDECDAIYKVPGVEI